MFTLRNFLTFRIPGIFKILLGIVFFLVGTWLTNWSYDSADPGDTYFVFQGAIIVGVVYALFGLYSFGAFLVRTGHRKIFFKNASELERQSRKQTIFEKAMQHGLVSILAVEDTIQIEEINDVSKILKDKTSLSPNPIQLQKLIKKAKRSSKRVSSYFFEIEPWLTSEQKGSLVLETFLIATKPDANPKGLRAFKSLILGLGIADDETAEIVSKKSNKKDSQKSKKAADKKVAAASVPPPKTTAKPKEGRVNKSGLSRGFKIGLYTFGGLTVFIILVRLLTVGDGGGGPTAAQIAQDNRMSLLEQERDQHLFRLKQINNDVQYLTNNNPDIVLALGATGIGGSVAMDSEQGGWTRFFGALAGLAGADYCVQNARACNQFIQEIKRLEGDYTLTRDRISAITLEVGYRIQLRNSCAVPFTMNVFFFDEEYDGAVSSSTVTPGQSVMLKDQHGFYYRTKYDAVQFYGKTTDDKLVWEGNQTQNVNGEVLKVQEYQYPIGDGAYGDINFTCG